MAKLLLLDFESTGLNLVTDRITQYAFDVWDTDTDESVQKTGYLWEPSYPKLTPEITRLTNITEEILTSQGEKPGMILDRLAQTAMQMDFLVAYSGTNFDKPLLEAECRRHNVSFPKMKWMDPRTDLPFPSRLKCRVLTHVALEHDFPVNRKQAHEASYDVEMMKYLLKQYDLKPILELCSQPRILIESRGTYNDKDAVKAKGYSWETIGDIKVPKTWIKLLRQSQWDAELISMESINVPIIQKLLE